MLLSACPYVLWKWTASFSVGTSALTARKSAWVGPADPMPMVSPRETS